MVSVELTSYALLVMKIALKLFLFLYLFFFLKAELRAAVFLALEEQEKVEV